MSNELADLVKRQSPFSGGVIQRKCDGCREKAHILQKAGKSALDSMLPIVQEVLRSPGRPLDAQIRSLMEPRFGQDLSGVRVHTDTKAAESAGAVDALAYTAGRDIVFGKGQYAPRTHEGQRLISHELTHVMQQSNQSPSNSFIQRKSAKGSTSSQWAELPTNAQRAIDETYFNGMDHEYQNAFRSVYSAMLAEGLWDDVVHVFNVFPRNVRGIDAISKSSLIGHLVSNNHFCRDTRTEKIVADVGSAIGKTFTSKKKRSKEIPKDKAEWRQVVSAGSDGLHVGVINPYRISIHLDTIAPVAGREPNGNCRYSMPHLLPHAGKDLLGGRNVEVFPPARSETQPDDVQPTIRLRIPGT